MRTKPPPFQTFLDEHRSRVMAFLLATVGPDDADDCFQETFLAALRSYPRLHDASNLRGWILTIAHRKAMDAHRGRARRPVSTPELPERETADAGIDRVLNGMHEAWQAAAKLPPRQRAAIAHRFVADLRYREIGELLGCSEAAARRSVADGLTNLRERMGT